MRVIFTRHAINRLKSDRFELNGIDIDNLIENVKSVIHKEVPIDWIPYKNIRKEEAVIHLYEEDVTFITTARFAEDNIQTEYTVVTCLRKDQFSKTEAGQISWERYTKNIAMEMGELLGLGEFEEANILFYNHIRKLRKDKSIPKRSMKAGMRPNLVVFLKDNTVWFRQETFLEKGPRELYKLKQLKDGEVLSNYRYVLRSGAEKFEIVDKIPDGFIEDFKIELMKASGTFHSFK